VLTAEDSSPADLEQVCGPVVNDVLRASLAAADRPAKFPGSCGNSSVKDLILRLTRSDGDGKDRAVTFEGAVGAAVAGNFSGSGAIGSVDASSDADESELILSEEFGSAEGEVNVSARLCRDPVQRVSDGLKLSIHESLIISDNAAGSGPRRSCRIKYNPQTFELSATGVAQDEISAEEYSAELHGALVESVSELSESVLQNHAGTDESFDSAEGSSGVSSSRSTEPSSTVSLQEAVSTIRVMLKTYDADAPTTGADSGGNTSEDDAFGTSGTQMQKPSRDLSLKSMTD